MRKGYCREVVLLLICVFSYLVGQLLVSQVSCRRPLLDAWALCHVEALSHRIFWPGPPLCLRLRPARIFWWSLITTYAAALLSCCWPSSSRRLLDGFMVSSRCTIDLARYLYNLTLRSPAGSERFCGNIADMIGYKPHALIKYSWMYSTPLMCIVSVRCSVWIKSNALVSTTALIIFPVRLQQGTLIFLIVRYTPIKFNNSYVYPWWGYAIGWFLASSSLIMIPIIMVCKVAKKEGTLWQVSGTVRTFYVWFS